MNAFARSPLRLHAIFLLVIATGCGHYGTTSRSVRDIKSVYVPFFANDTAEPDLEITVTEGIINSLIDDNTLDVVDESRADALLEGRIVQFDNRPVSFDPDLNAQEYRLRIHVVVSLYNRRTNKPLWEKRRITGEAPYFLEPVENENTFDTAKKQAIQLITDRILNLTVQDW